MSKRMIITIIMMKKKKILNNSNNKKCTHKKTKTAKGKDLSIQSHFNHFFSFDRMILRYSFLAHSSLNSLT